MDCEIWIAACAHRLQRQWRTVDPELLEEVAGDLWADQALRELAPQEAAVVWLEPVASGSDSRTRRRHDQKDQLR